MRAIGATSERMAITLDGARIECTVRRSRRRRKTIAISFDSDGELAIAVPMRTSSKEIRQIVQHRAEWIARKAAELRVAPKRSLLRTGDTLPYLGGQLALHVVAADVRRLAVQLVDGKLEVVVPSHLAGDEVRAVIARLLTRWFRMRADERLPSQVAHWALACGVRPSRVLVRDQRRRWGSCSSDDAIRLNWRLVMAPPALSDYVIVHELAHLRVRNHSPAFWREVAKFVPDYKARRTQLRKLGPTLSI